jgi:hypothetical protein
MMRSRTTRHERKTFAAGAGALAWQRALALALTLLAAGSAVGQDGAGKRPGAAADTAHEVPESTKQRYKWLFEPDFAELGLARDLPESGVAAEKPDAPFKAGEPIVFRLLIKNISPEGKAILTAGTYKHNRPRLFLDGELLPYRGDVAELVRSEDSFYYPKSKFAPLGPQATQAEIIDLGAWYGPLKPGSYKLVVRHRFIWGGRWLEPPPLTFNVVG